MTEFQPFKNNAPERANAQIYIVRMNTQEAFDSDHCLSVDKTSLQEHADGCSMLGMYAGSRSGWCHPDDELNGLAQWVLENSDELFKNLGVGWHYGEWQHGGKFNHLASPSTFPLTDAEGESQ